MTPDKYVSAESILAYHARLYYDKETANGLIRERGNDILAWIGVARICPPKQTMPHDSVSYLFDRNTLIPWRIEDMWALVSCEPTTFIWEHRLSPTEMMQMWCWKHKKPLLHWLTSTNPMWSEIRDGLENIKDDSLPVVPYSVGTSNKEKLRIGSRFVANRLNWDE